MRDHAMRLLQQRQDGTVVLSDDLVDNIPPYAILSHTWGRDDQEVTFDNVTTGNKEPKDGYRKIAYCGKQAALDKLEYFWVDTCCIDKKSSAELQEAITSMFRWYKTSTRCYVYLSDVRLNESDPEAWQLAFRQSRWFTRGWTLQELLAPSSVEFFDQEWRRLGDKILLVDLLHEITGVPVAALRGHPLSTFSINERMLWARGRDTKRKEDKAYALIGILGITMVTNYGEGEDHAMERLRKELRPPPRIEGQVTQCIIPLGRNRSFIGRDHILKDLMKIVPPHVDPQDCQRIAIEGLGGVGKTQIALEIAYRMQENYPECSIFWVPTIDRTAFEKGYRDIGQALKIPGIEENKADVKALVKAALDKSSSHWLLIIDNLDDTELFSDDNEEYALTNHLPYNTKGSILFTTRNHEAVVGLDIDVDQTFTINELSEEEAVKMLRKGLKPHQMKDTESIKTLLDLLAYLPLAIKQAAAYMARTGTTTKKYLEQYRLSDESKIDLLSKHFEDRGRYRGVANPIATTWLVSFSHIERNHPLAARYLRLICALGEKDIPKILLPGYEEDLMAEEAVGILQGYSFISHREESDSLDIHRLVRLATRNSLEKELDNFTDAAMSHLSKVYPHPDYQNRHIWIRYMPHTEAVLESSKACQVKTAQAKLLHKIARSYELLGLYKLALQRHRLALHLREMELGRNHPDTLNSMHSLANELSKLGQYQEAENMHRQVFQSTQELLGPKHPDTATSMHSLADILAILGQSQEAKNMYQQAFHLSQEVLGPKHPYTLISMRSLANALERQGQYQEAENMHRHVFQLTREVLGPEHPNTLASMRSLAHISARLGQYQEAENIHRQVFQLCRESLGPKHPFTLRSMNSYANQLANLEKYEEAEPMFRQAAQFSQEALGAEHPDSLIVMKNLELVLDKKKTKRAKRK